eukprot:scaffold4498_cov119-Isochrysis_galbana.AAC.41
MCSDPSAPPSCCGRRGPYPVWNYPQHFVEDVLQPAQYPQYAQSSSLRGRDETRDPRAHVAAVDRSSQSVGPVARILLSSRWPRSRGCPTLLACRGRAPQASPPDPFGFRGGRSPRPPNAGWGALRYSGVSLNGRLFQYFSVWASSPAPPSPACSARARFGVWCVCAAGGGRRRRGGAGCGASGSRGAKWPMGSWGRPAFSPYLAGACLEFSGVISNKY